MMHRGGHVVRTRASHENTSGEYSDGAVRIGIVRKDRECVPCEQGGILHPAACPVFTIFRIFFYGSMHMSGLITNEQHGSENEWCMSDGATLLSGLINHVVANELNVCMHAMVQDRSRSRP